MSRYIHPVNHDTTPKTTHTLLLLHMPLLLRLRVNRIFFLVGNITDFAKVVSQSEKRFPADPRYDRLLVGHQTAGPASAEPRKTTKW